MTNFAAIKVIKTINIYCTFRHFGLSVHDSKDRTKYYSPRGQGQGLTSLAFWQLYSTPNSFSAGALPWTPLGELIVLPQTLSWF